jgi:hypothetical protein
MVSTGLATALVAVGGGSAAAQERQTYTERFTTETPGAATGRIYSIDYFDPADRANGKPHAFSHLKVELAEGARFDTSALPHCKASDAELMAQGPAACPSETRVGTDETVVDTGSPGPGRYMTANFSFFNNDRELILLAVVRENDLRVVVRAKIGERTLDIENPFIPGTPPEGTSARSQRGLFEPRTGVVAGRQANYITTPPTCPPSGYWVNRITWTYRDGVEQSAESRSPCAHPDDAAPAIRWFGVPSPCARRAFRAHLRVSDASRLRSVRVRLHGRTIATSVHRRLSARIPAGALTAGRHAVEVTAVDGAGNRAVRTFRFRRCAR